MFNHTGKILRLKYITVVNLYVRNICAINYCNRLLLQFILFASNQTLIVNLRYKIIPKVIFFLQYRCGVY